MPPVRGPVSAKGLKTERTHEENQERAYIAASRRSDRSLEARIESARRASEIHKKRTGRALRVTEQDVINEEMYEEEDDDLQSQYRRLQAHLGSSADLFNGRLNAWVLSQYGTRQLAMAAQAGMTFNPSAAMPQPTVPFFAYQPQAQPQSPTGTMSPGAMQRAQSYRQAPYPTQQLSRMSEQRSMSMDQGAAGMTSGVTESQMLHQRRHSMAAPSADGHSVPTTPLEEAGSAKSPLSRRGSEIQPGRMSSSTFFNDQGFQSMMSPTFQFNGYPTGTSSFDPMNQMQNPISPLTTSLPVEAQQVIGTSFDPNSQFTPFFMNMSHGQPVPAGINYTYRPNAGIPLKSEGINQTLSPNPLVTTPKVETNLDHMTNANFINTSATSGDSYGGQFTTYGFNGSFGLGMDFDKTPGDTNSVNTPDNNFFNDWVADQNPAREEIAN